MLTLQANIQMLEQFVNLRIASMSSLNTLQPHLNSALSLTNTVQKIKSLFNTFIHIDKTHYHDLSAIEWSLVIKTIMIIFELLVLAFSQVDLDAGAIQQLSSLSPFLKTLQNRMKETVSTRQDTKVLPEICRILDSVLEMVHEKYSRMVEQLSLTNTLKAPHPGVRFNSATLCPVMNGSLKYNSPTHIEDIFSDDFNFEAIIGPQADSIWLKQ